MEQRPLVHVSIQVMFGTCLCGVDFKSQDLPKREENKTGDDRTARVKVSTYADDVLLW